MLVKVTACGLCRTDLHVVDGELTRPKLPLIPGHQVVGEIAALGAGVTDLAPGERVGVPWLGWTCGTCEYCRRGQENLCDRARFTGYDIDGGYAEYTVADARFAFRIDPSYSDVQAAPLLCAGLIGYRALAAAGDGTRLGLYGFGAAAHIVAQVARHQGRRVFALTRPGDIASQDVREGARRRVGRRHGSAAARGARRRDHLRAGRGARAAGAGGRCKGRHGRVRGDPHERHPVVSVLAAVGRARGALGGEPREAGRLEFLALAPQIPVRTTVETMPLAEANQALTRLREGRVQGALVLTIA